MARSHRWLLAVFAMLGSGLAGCETTYPDKVATGGASESLSGSAGSPTQTTPSAEATALVSGQFSLYATTDARWVGGACVELRMKNNGSTVVGWSLRLTMSQPIATCSYQSGGYMNWWADQLVIDPLNDNLTFEGGTSKLFRYCAEPGTHPIMMQMSAAGQMPPAVDVDASAQQGDS